MKATIYYKNSNYNINLLKPLDLTLPIQSRIDAASAWYCPPSEISPVITEHFVGSVQQGGSVNFNNIVFNPHGNGTHTECVGHIAKEFYSINKLLDQFFFLAQLVSITPFSLGEDLVITLEQIQAVFEKSPSPQAFIVRTLPNSASKQQQQYTNTNPPFVEPQAMNWLYEQGVRHFLIDTPSVDKEVDDGVLAAHHAFWNYPSNPRLDATITELIYVPDTIKDAIYFLNLQVAAFENDATPSKPTLYAID
ncbi:cyclase family protein [Aureispira anguillae]|uniref:Cyclase family protein n=1 Tax=Aureispira anguillae TaxID=2864201 RepID=A0A916DRT5_9BACT|nr:cyclase family protein [Aureispira anguillae]BDS10825.1 cyclase family protein [Aureispira anguillae]